jgi:trans-2-enoyl-CoA reductase
MSKRTVITRSTTTETVKVANGKTIRETVTTTTTEESGDAAAVRGSPEWIDWWKQFDRIFERKS